MADGYLDEIRVSPVVIMSLIYHILEGSVSGENAVQEKLCN